MAGGNASIKNVHYFHCVLQRWSCPMHFSAVVLSALTTLIRWRFRVTQRGYAHSNCHERHIKSWEDSIARRWSNISDDSPWSQRDFAGVQQHGRAPQVEGNLLEKKLNSSIRSLGHAEHGWCYRYLIGRGWERNMIFSQGLTNAMQSATTRSHWEPKSQLAAVCHVIPSPQMPRARPQIEGGIAARYALSGRFVRELFDGSPGAAGWDPSKDVLSVPDMPTKPEQDLWRNHPGMSHASAAQPLQRYREPDKTSRAISALFSCLFCFWFLKKVYCSSNIGVFQYFLSLYHFVSIFLSFPFLISN
jgi:hypothetical protein